MEDKSEKTGSKSEHLREAHNLADLFINKREVTKMKYAIGKMVVVILMGLMALTQMVSAANEFANGPWGDNTKINVGISLQSGQSISAWEDRGDESSNRIQWMNAVGDGTYEYQFNLIPTAAYNFMFFAVPKISTQGFVAGTTYPEPCPNGQTEGAKDDMGTFISTWSNGGLRYTASGSLMYGSIGGDGRRLFTMPDLTSGDTIYVFNNFASTPTGVANYSATVSSSVANGGRINLTWSGCHGYWGTTFASPDCLGGGYTIYKGTGVTSSHLFYATATLHGGATYWQDVNVPDSIWYYYIIVASDSYKGNNVVNNSTHSAFTQLARRVPVDGTYWSDNAYNVAGGNDKRGKPAAAVPVIFKVEGGDMEYIEQHGNIVWLTPADQDGRIYPYKVPGILIRVRGPGL